MKIGLALGGGGVRGMSHIPVLQAFDELGLKPHAIAGTSIGAILGAGYASGLSGSDLRKIALDLFSDRNKTLGHLWKLRPKRLADLWSGANVVFDPVKVLEIFVAEHLPDHFEDLDIPLTVLATDFYGCQEVDISSGPLLPAIAASIAIPAVFRPVKRQERILVDGGVVNPLPFDRLPEDCDIVVAVDVVGSPVPRPDRHLPSSFDAFFGTSQILMQTITQEKLKRRKPDILLQPEHDLIRVLDFMKTPEVLEKAEPLRKEAIRQLDLLLSNEKYQSSL
ncbi:patatin [Roseibium aquae]|uniref:Patatin n=1 Tax=Roseibium aquae TaxID=1323746 RepID=A0A916X298_9HYPH|nr:patatin-like phospholipase family protein [Roseibium aquae]GGB52476.1 patatin [Roseibium aquae]